MTLLELSDVNTFYGEMQVLFDISLEVNEHETVALLGRNGAGKSTVFNSIMNSVTPQSGTITYKGEEITGQPTHEISLMGISLVPAERRIFPNLTVDENLTIAKEGKNGSDEDIENVFELFPVLEEMGNRLGQNLSGGEQQMLSIGRGLIGNPDLLLLDEPIEGLAPHYVDAIMDGIHDITSELDTTVVVIDHAIYKLLSVSDRAYILNNGQVAHVGPADELRENEELLDRHFSVGEA